jgi:hypothetical protein
MSFKFAPVFCCLASHKTRILDFGRGASPGRGKESQGLHPCPSRQAERRGSRGGSGKGGGVVGRRRQRRNRGRRSRPRAGPAAPPAAVVAAATTGGVVHLDQGRRGRPSHPRRRPRAHAIGSANPPYSESKLPSQGSAWIESPTTRSSATSYKRAQECPAPASKTTSFSTTRHRSMQHTLN